MSGIFGIIRLPGVPVADAELAPMAETLKHRGPDGISYFARDNAGLGHCMLQSTPESLHETLPFRDEASGLTITADARIDNREQLLADIPVRASSGQVVTDSQLILHAYSKWGENCVDHLLGDFAFAIWDEHAQSLFVARDHMGCKPFYYHCHDGLFVFASSAMAVARVPEVKATLNEGRVADYLVKELEGINKTCSWYNEISRMPPAQCGYFRDNSFKYRQYWTLEPADLSHLNTDEDYLQAFTEVYTEAVRCRLRCQTEPASMLSGGLDSSTIVALARDLLLKSDQPPLRTYSAISEQEYSCPETKSVNAVVSRGNIRSTSLRPSDIDRYSASLFEARKNIEDPFDGRGALLSLMFLSSSNDHCRVVLDGLDGEHAVGAPTNYLGYVLGQGSWRVALNEARGFSEHYYRSHYSSASLFLRAMRSQVTPTVLRTLKRRVMASSRSRRLCTINHISPQLAGKVNLPRRIWEYDQSLVYTPGVSMQNWHKHVMQVPYLVSAVERYERLAGCFGVDARHPLLDIRLLQFSNAMPWQYKVRNGWSKYLLRLLAESHLPRSVAWREGWEELGWMFAVQRVRNFDLTSGFPLERMRKRLGAYLNQQAMAPHLPIQMAEENADNLIESWVRYCLYDWLESLQI